MAEVHSFLFIMLKLSHAINAKKPRSYMIFNLVFYQYYTLSGSLSRIISSLLIGNATASTCINLKLWIDLVMVDRWFCLKIHLLSTFASTTIDLKNYIF